MAIFVQDSFTDTDGTALEAHVGEVGAVWTPHTAVYPATAAVIEAGRVRFSQARGNSSSFYASGVPSGAEYDVECDLYINTIHDEAVGVIARARETVNTMYLARLGYSGGIDLYRFVNGSTSQIASVSYPVTTGQTIHLKLEVRDAAKRVLIDGVEYISSPDNAITDAGRAGIRSYRQYNDPAPGIGVHVDNFVATDLSGGTPEPVTLSGYLSELPLVQTLSALVPSASKAEGLQSALPLVQTLSATVPTASQASLLYALPLEQALSAVVPSAASIEGMISPLPLEQVLALVVGTGDPATVLSGMLSVLPLDSRISAVVTTASRIEGMTSPLPLEGTVQAVVPSASRAEGMLSALPIEQVLSLIVSAATQGRYHSVLDLKSGVSILVPVASELGGMISALPLYQRLSIINGVVLVPNRMDCSVRPYYQITASVRPYYDITAAVRPYYDITATVNPAIQ